MNQLKTDKCKFDKNDINKTRNVVNKHTRNSCFTGFFKLNIHLKWKWFAYSGNLNTFYGNNTFGLKCVINQLEFGSFDCLNFRPFKYMDISYLSSHQHHLYANLYLLPELCNQSWILKYWFFLLQNSMFFY